MSVTTGKSTVFPWVGSIYNSRIGKNNYAVASIHPAFALRSPGYLPVWQTFVARAAKLAQGTLKPWDWGRLVYEEKGPGDETVAALQELLGASKLSIDIENHPDSGHIRCIGVGTSALAVSVLLPPEGPFHSRTDELLRALLVGPALKVLQNGRHDRRELRATGYEVKGPYFDTLLAHAIVAPRLKHDLGFMAAVEFHAERWKSEFKNASEDKGRKKKVASVFGSASPGELLPYNCKDNIAQARLEEVLGQRLGTVHRGWELFNQATELNEIALKMQDAGIDVDLEAKEAHRTPLLQELGEIEAEFRRIEPDEAFRLGKNGQHPSLKELFLGKFSCKVVSWNEDTNQPSLDGKALTRYIGDHQRRAPHVSRLAFLALKFREKAKLLGSYIESLPVEADGKVHPQWNIFGARTGRWAAKDPAMQTIPTDYYETDKDGNVFLAQRGLRNIFCARDGNWIVEADYQRLEIYVMALLSGDPLLLEWCNAGRDVYIEAAKQIFKVAEPSKQQRKVTKSVVLGKNYGASEETAWRSLLVEFPTLPLAAVSYAMRQLEKNHPRVEEFAAEMYRTAEDQGYVEEVLSGRRQYYHDGRISPTEVRNYPIQGAAGTMANRAILAVDKAVRWDAGESIIMQVHDAIALRGSDPERLAGILRDSMEQTLTHKGNTLKFRVDVKAGRNWGQMQAA